MKENVNVKEQFNKQSVNFDRWPVTRDEAVLDSLFHFFALRPGDRLLDIACGTGAFAAHAGRRIKAVQGVDISEGMIKIARENASRLKLDNIDFRCCDVENIPLESGGFDCVVSKSAFHHMKNIETVFKEMIRCCRANGGIGLQDIVSYEDNHLDGFFEELEREIDASHHLTRSKQEIIDLYKRNRVRITRLFESTAELDFNGYVNHAVQTETAGERIKQLLETGLKDGRTSKWFVNKNGVLYWKRRLITMAGQK